MSRTYAIDPSMAWHDIESNREHLKMDGEHYVADAMLFRDNLNLRQENESLREENDRLRMELDFYRSQVDGVEEERHRLRKRWEEAVAENTKQRELGIEV